MNGHPGDDGREFGLEAMTQRLQQVDGVLEIESAPGARTAVNDGFEVVGEAADGAEAGGRGGSPLGPVR